MDTTLNYSTDVAFTPSVKEIQTRRGSRRAYARMEERGPWSTTITPDLAAFIAEQESVFLATSSRDGQPYVQHRGGPTGFLKVLDDKTIAFADFFGNRRYITQGNLAENPKAHLNLIDFVQRRRIKIWGEARVVVGDASLVAELLRPGYRTRAEQAILFTVTAWVEDCRQHIPLRFDALAVAAALAERDIRVAELERQVKALQAAAKGRWSR